MRQGVWPSLDSVVCYILDNLADTLKFHKKSKVGLVLSKKEVMGRLLSSGFSHHYWSRTLKNEVINIVIVLRDITKDNLGTAGSTT